MDQWMDALNDVVNLILGNPGLLWEKAALAVLGAGAMMLVLDKAGKAFGIPNTGASHSIVVAVVGVVLILAAMTAAKIYLPDAGVKVNAGILAGVAAAVSLVLIVPFCCLFQKTGYFAALFTWILGAAAAAVVIAVVGAGLDAVTSGRHGADGGRQHRRDVEQMMGQ